MIKFLKLTLIIGFCIYIIIKCAPSDLVARYGAEEIDAFIALDGQQEYYYKWTMYEILRKKLCWSSCFRIYYSNNMDAYTIIKNIDEIKDIYFDGYRFHAVIFPLVDIWSNYHFYLYTVVETERAVSTQNEEAFTHFTTDYVISEFFIEHGFSPPFTFDVYARLKKAKDYDKGIHLYNIKLDWHNLTITRMIPEPKNEELRKYYNYPLEETLLRELETPTIEITKSYNRIPYLINNLLYFDDSEYSVFVIYYEDANEDYNHGQHWDF